MNPKKKPKLKPKNLKNKKKKKNKKIKKMEPFATFAMGDAQRIVDGIPADRKVVLLGESTHGTEEFYRTRLEITKRLVVERGFTAVCFEADWPFMQAAGAYTRGKRSTPFPLDGEGAISKMDVGKPVHERAL